ncbi:helix-turn-helix transcriptional regulator [Kitasatospora sp. NPDC001527]|uniref:helix-turn-helix domain-containing protein n=1 Tax=Kitasatospora sp. NPDC001527 TaxID=3154519 RepID=UPI00332C43AC
MGRPGRPERPLDPDAGPVEAFAHALRALRREAGSPSYRWIAARAHYSHTVVSDAARGERLPTLAVTLAFVEACGADRGAWEARWHLHQQLAAAGTRTAPADADAAPEPDAAPSAEPEHPEHPEHPEPSEPSEPDGASPRRRFRRLPGRRATALAALLLALALVLGAGTTGWLLRPVPAAPTTPPVEIEDGTNPKLAGCTADAVILDSAPVTLRAEARLHGSVLPVGTVLGTVSLMYSSHCAGAWPRFFPTPGLNPDPGDTAAAIVTVEGERAIDNTVTTWRMGHVDSAFADVLLTGHGCVTARARVQMAGQDAFGTGETKCLTRWRA